MVLFSTANRLTDSHGETTRRRRCLLLESLVKGCDSLRGILLTSGAPHRGDPGTPPWPPALLIDVCRCACLHDNGLHWGSPLQCPSINHTGDTERTEPFVCVFSRLWAWACLCVLICFVYTYTAWGAPCCIIDGPQGGMKVWIVAAKRRGGGRKEGGGESGWRQISECLDAFGRPTMHWHSHPGTAIGFYRIQCWQVRPLKDSEAGG